jgi:oligopeptidase A
MTNPLLDFTDLPQFATITPEHVAPAVEALLKDANAALEKVTAADFPADWKAMSAALDVPNEKLGRAWGAVNHLNSVVDTPELRAAYNEALPKVVEFSTRAGSDERLYAKYKAMNVATLSKEQAKAHSNAIRGFKLGGADLQGAAKERFAAIQERQAELSQKFSENALDSTEAFSYLATAQELVGVPADVVHTAREAAKAQFAKDEQADNPKLHRLTLKMPCYLPVMQFATSSALRERLYKANATRASELFEVDGKARAEFDNSALITEILALRQEESVLLGYDNFAQVSLVPKMADSPAQVITFLRDLAKRARPFALQDVADLRAFATKELGIADPQPWDWAFIGEKLKEARYSFSEQEVKQYFTAPKVLAGLFKIVETLFDVAIVKDSAPVWNEKVEFYALQRNGKTIAQFYLDQPARTGKRGGAWMDDVRGRWLRPDTGALQTPVAHLVCNFADGVDGKPALLTHDDVTTLFHEFGHGLQHMLTQVNEREVSGISGVEWDAVELPSQFMENFCWEWDVLKHMTAHVDTGAPLPRALFDKMLAAKNYQSGLQTLRQVEFALFDMLLHETAASNRGNALQVLQTVRDEVAVLPAPAYSRTPNTFSHIFSGGYAAGYYSYKWAELLSADAYAAFEEDTADNTPNSATNSGKNNATGQPASQLGSPSANMAAGQRYRQEILEVGGSRSAMESFVAFRGREPRIDALLRHQGMA